MVSSLITNLRLLHLSPSVSMVSILTHLSPVTSNGMCCHITNRQASSFRWGVLFCLVASSDWACYVQNYGQDWLADNICQNQILNIDTGSNVQVFATVMTDIFQKKLNYDDKKWAKNRENICGDRTYQKPAITFWHKRIRRLFPTVWSGHELVTNFGQILWPLHSVGNICPILFGQNVTPQSLTCSIHIFSQF